VFHSFKSDVYGKVTITVLAVEFLNVTVLVVPDSILDEVTRMAMNTVRNDYRGNDGLVLLSYLFSNSDAKLNGMNVLATDLSKLMIRTGAMPDSRGFDYVIIHVSGLRMYMVMIIRNSDKVAFECYLFSFFFPWILFHTTSITYYYYLNMCDKYYII